MDFLGSELQETPFWEAIKKETFLPQKASAKVSAMTIIFISLDIFFSAWMKSI